MTISTAPSQEYLDTLLLYYEEEIMGEAYFHALATQYPDPVKAHKMTLMAEVERHAANAVRPLLDLYALTPRTETELHHLGREEIDPQPADWPDLITEMQRSFPDYMPQFQALEDMAPLADRPRLAFLTAHETAAIAFLNLEAEGADGTEPMRAYLNSDPENMTPA